MAAIPGYKISQFAKDLGLKNKDILDIISSDAGVKKNHSAQLDADEFALVFEALTSNRQIDSLDDYLSGRVVIVSEAQLAKKAAAEKAAADKAAAAKAAADKAAAEKAAADKAAADKAAADKAAEKAAAEKAAADKAAAEKAAVEKQPVKKPAAMKPTETAASKTETPVKAEAAPKAETSVKATETAAPDKSAQPEAAEAPKPITEGRRLPGKMIIQQPQKPAAKPSAKPSIPVKPTADKAAADKTSADKASDKPVVPGYNPTGKFRPEQLAEIRNQQRAAQQQRQAQASQPVQPQKPAAPRKPVSDEPPKKTEKAPKALGQGQVKLAPSPGATPFVITNPVAPKEKKQEAPGRTRTGTTRVVDTRTSGNVDLSKYDESLDKYIPSTVKDTAAERQKLKKQNNRDTFSRGRDREKERMAMEKMRRANIEKFKKIQHHITVPDEITVGELATRLKATAGDVVKRLMKMGVMAGINQVIDYDTAYLIADEMGIKCEREVVVTIEDKLFDEHNDAEGELVGRAPVVCVMGHVDHGKTSLLDAIRNTNVTEGEAGGITQHIGAYRVNVKGKEITFLDTPGHEAFTAMRARGAQATDIAILVVAADDGIMPQTVEAINHAKAAGVDIVVAINKMDKPGANPEGIKNELTKYDLVPEDWGGDVMCVPVSALTRMGIDDLLENILLIAEVKEYKANPERRAKGIVIEAKLDKGRGPVATVLVQNGTLHTGDIVIAGTSVGRVRVMTDYKGVAANEAGPSVPVEIVGLAEVPTSGDQWSVVEDERMARTLADQRRDAAREEEFRANAKVNLDDLFTQIAEGVKDLNIIVKADVVGSAEAVKSSLERLSNEEVKVKIIHTAVGGISEGDVTFAAASNAIIVGFNVRPDKAALDSAERQGVDVRTYRVIYDCIDEIQSALKGMLAPKFKENLLGHAEVRQLIKVPNIGVIAGSYVQDGSVTRKSMIRVVRDGVVIFEDKISSLRRFKDDVSEVKSGYECGIGLEKFNDIRERDILEAYIMEQIEV